MRGSAIEDELGRALGAAALDLLEEGLATDAFAKALLVTDNDEIAALVPRNVEVDRDRGTFHFGKRLAGIVRKHKIQKPLYVGAGGVPLLRGSDLAGIAHRLAQSDGVVIANNYYSADLVAFAPGSAIQRVELPDADNFLPRLLHDQAALVSEPLPRSAATQFNIDSPADLTMLKLCGGAGPRLAEYLSAFEARTEPYERLMLHLVNPKSEVLVAGRVGSAAWSYLERETACRIRLFSEERGMQAAGRDGPGMARSMLAFHVREAGMTKFFRHLAELGDVACIDTRPMLSHLGIDASRPDRFNSDLGRPEAIDNGFLREFTYAAVEAPLPVILGGHSLVSGGLMLLTEHAWREEDKRIAQGPA
jgi:hypothetical protein